MRILLISKNYKAVNTYQTLLGKEKLNVESIVYVDSFNLKKQLEPYLCGSIDALILDRVEVEIDEVINAFGNVDVFFVLENWDSLGTIKCNSNNSTYRFYLWPVNYTLLTDDIKSICLFKEYLQAGKIELENIFIDLNTHTISDGETIMSLKKQEFDLLVYLAQNRGKVLSRYSILENVWDMNAQIVTNTVDVHVSKLRKLLRENFGITNLIKTIPCCGYQLV